MPEKEVSLKSRASEIRRVMSETITNEDVRGMTLAMIQKAVEGDTGAFRELMDRVVGKPSQQFEITETVTMSRERLMADFMRVVEVRSAMPMIEAQVDDDNTDIQDN